MNLIGIARICLVVALFCSSVARGSILEDIGVTGLRTVTNLDASGIRIAQPEAGYGAPDNWEVNPSSFGLDQPVSKFTYISSLGTATNFPNSVGAESGHAEAQVGEFLYRVSDGLATNMSHLDNYEANYFINNIVAAVSPPPIAASVVNQSFADTDTNTQSTYDTYYDNYAAQYKTLFISGAGDGGPVLPPSTCYNGISVGAYQYYVNFGSTGPTPDGGRCKPDITAVKDITSSSCPQVCGAAALLEQAALRGDGGADTNSAFDLRTIKALLLNGAVKPANWTNAAGQPLDLRYGAGVLNVLNSYEQFRGGKRPAVVTNNVSTGGAHLPTGASGTVGALAGWNLATNTSSTLNDTIHHYFFNVTNPLSTSKFTATATLVWMRHKNKSSINNLDLFLYDCANSNLVTASTSTVDNVEHVWHPGLPPGRYDLQVWKAGGVTVSTNETYALAFEFVPDPTLSVSGQTNLTLRWPIYPAGYAVEYSTNLLSGNWRTNGLPSPVITNGGYSIPLNITNPLQFFRLRKPNL